VRHSETATERQFTEIEDMTCTMRVWHKTSERPSSEQNLPIAVDMKPHHGPSHLLEGGRRSFFLPAKREGQPGPELILTPVSNALVEQPHLCCSADFGTDPIPLSDRFVSFGSVDNSISNRSGRGSVTRSPKASFSSFRRDVTGDNDNTTTARRILGAMTIPVRDIMMMYTTGSSKDPSEVNRINITTMSSGFFELTMDSTNGRDVVKAFLKASMPKERVVASGDLSRTRSGSTQSTKSFDVEAFTATRMSERLKSESLTEKVQRRIDRFVTSLNESKCALSI
jgi:hypothetical protein